MDMYKGGFFKEGEQFSPEKAKKYFGKLGIPIWLFNVIQNFNTPQLFKRGASGFANLCEKNIDHVNRIARKKINKSLTDLVNELRMKFAAQQFAITNAQIKNICNDCGYKNLGYFYKVFKEIYRLTPFQYRKINQKIV
jgi:methylphosphotriester-DNA--protein-cysteine methyltransferase